VEIKLTEDVTLVCTDRIKALGVWLDFKLSWVPHITETRNRIIKLLNGLKIIRKKLNHRQSLMVVTSRVFSVLYYASPVWLSPASSKKLIAEVEKLHYKALRVVTMDHKQRSSRQAISRKTQRLPPTLWIRFAAASTLMKMWFSNRPHRLRTAAFVNTFTKRRGDGLLFGYDDSTHKIGRQMTKNWCGGILGAIRIPWTGEVFSSDRLRTVLKSTFYPADFYVFNY